MIEFKIPDLGENIHSADIGHIAIKEGDTIEKDQVILELETEKAVFELPCPHAGVITKLHVAEGQTVEVGALVATIDEAKGSNGAPSKGGAKKESPSPATRAAPAVERSVSPAPAASKIPSSANISAISRHRPPIEERPSIGKSPTTARDAGPATAPGRLLAESGDALPIQGNVPPPAGPATRRLARELGVDLHRVIGTGPGQRITSDDVQAFVRGLASKNATSAAPLPDFSGLGEVERRPMNKVARTAAAQLTTAWQTIPHVTQHELADITDLEAGRKRFVERRPELPKVTMTAIAIKAVLACVKAFPHFNASCDLSAGELIIKNFYNVGIAVDTPTGLLVPVVKNADRLTLTELARAIDELARKARDRKIELADLKGGTFTVSNLGGIGGTAFTPIINPPEVAILGLSKSRWQCEWIDGKPTPRLMLPLSLSYDHRVINGADAARFTSRLAQLLSDPVSLLIEG